MNHGGKTIYGATLGILMLETQFPRIHGDIGNAQTWPFPVQYRVVRGATPQKAVREDSRALLKPFVEAGKDLIAAGCDGIATNCGFLSLLQDDMQDALGVPVASSSLMQTAMVQAMLPKSQRVGILTISKSTLSAAHLAAANVPEGSPIGGTDETGEFSSKILGNHPTLDVELCRDEMIQASQALVTQNPDIGAIVLECTNMVPFAADVRKATGRPVFSIYTYLCWVQSALLPRRFNEVLDDFRI